MSDFYSGSKKNSFDNNNKTLKVNVIEEQNRNNNFIPFSYSRSDNIIELMNK